MLKEIEDYIKYIKEFGYSIKTVYGKVYAVRKLADFMDKEDIKDLSKIDSPTVKAFEKYLTGINRKKTSITKHLKRAREFFNYLIASGKIKTNPFSTAKKEPSYPEEFKKYFDEYIRIKESEITSKESLKRMKASIRILFSFFTEIEITRFSQITRNDIKSFITHLIDKKDKNGNSIYKPISINRILFDIKNFILFLKDRKICPDVLGAIVNLRQAEKVSRNILTKKEIADLFRIEVENLYQFMMKTLFVCLYSTGLRVSELLSLKMNDIDQTNKVLTVYESKTKKERHVHIGDIGLCYLNMYLTHARDKIGYDSDKSNLVFVSSTESSEISRCTVNKYLRIFCLKTGITKKITSHCFRHSYGSHFLENGADIKIISELLGHSQISSTERYTRLGIEGLREIINTFHPREQEVNKWN